MDSRQVIYAFFLALLLLGCGLTDGGVETETETAAATQPAATEAVVPVDTTPTEEAPVAMEATAVPVEPTATSAPAEATATAGPSPLVDLSYNRATTGEELDLTLPDTGGWDNRYGGGVNAVTGVQTTWVQSASSQAFFDNNDLRFGDDIRAAALGTAALNLGPDLYLIVFALNTDVAEAAETPLATLAAIIDASDLTVYEGPAETTLAELPAAQVTRTGTSADGIDMTVLSYVIFSETQVVTLSYYWPTSAADYYAPVVANVLAELTVLR